MKRRIVSSSQITTSSFQPTNLVNEISKCVKELIAENPEVLTTPGHQIYMRNVPNSVDITPVFDYMEYVYEQVADAICNTQSEIASVLQHHGYDVRPDEISITVPSLRSKYSTKEYLVQGTFEVRSESEYRIAPPQAYPTIIIDKVAIVRNVSASDAVISRLLKTGLVEDSRLLNWSPYIPLTPPAVVTSEYIANIVRRFAQDGLEYRHYIEMPFSNCQYLADKLTKIDQGMYTTNVGDTSISLKRFFNKSNIPTTTGNFYSDYIRCMDAIVSSVIQQLYPQCSVELKTMDDTSPNFEHTLVLKFTDCIIRYSLSSDVLEHAYEQKGCMGIISHVLGLLRSEKAGRKSVIKYPKQG